MTLVENKINEILFSNGGVCEWTDGEAHWETSCGDTTFSWSSIQGKIICPFCCKNIKFKEI